MENYKKITLEELTEAISEFYGKSNTEIKEKKLTYLKKIGENTWEISDGYRTVWTNDAGKKQFDEAFKKAGKELISKAETNENQNNYPTRSIEEMMKNPETLPYANMKMVETPIYNMKESDNKYFTPDIEDIRVGYECEWKLDKADYLEYHDKSVYDWKKHIVVLSDFHGGEMDDYYSFTNPMCKIRVPYLTKEQIEAEGWEFNINYETVEDSKWPDEMGFSKELSDNKTQFLAYYNPTNLTLRIEKIYDFGVEGWIFMGECKCVNNFRYICKLLNIK